MKLSTLFRNVNNMQTPNLVYLTELSPIQEKYRITGLRDSDRPKTNFVTGFGYKNGWGLGVEMKNRGSKIGGISVGLSY